MKNYKIAVAGTGYVGLSLGVLLSQHHQVVAVDIVQAKVDMINNKKSPIRREGSRQAGSKENERRSESRRGSKKSRSGIRSEKAACRRHECRRNPRKTEIIFSKIQNRVDGVTKSHPDGFLIGRLLHIEQKMHCFPHHPLKSCPVKF